MDSVTKAQIVWAETKDLAVPQGGDPATLTALRRLIAAIADEAPRDFPDFEALPARDDPDFGADVLDCAGAVEAAPSPANRNLRLIIWPSADGRTLKADEIPPPPPWDAASPGGFDLVGRFKVKDREVSAFSRAVTAGEDAPRFFSLVTGAGLPPDTGVYAPKPVLRKPISSGARWASRGFVVACVLLFAFACLWSLSVGSLAGSASIVFSASPDSETCPTSIDKNQPTTLFGSPLAWLPDKEGKTRCLTAWREAEAKTLSAGRGDWWGNTKSVLAGWTVSEASAAFSLRLPTLAAMTSIVLLAIATGYGVVGRPLGLFIDSRNRMSLTRLQFAVWLVVLMGGLTSYALFNVGFWGGDLARIRAGLAFLEANASDQSLKALPAALAQLLDFVPTMDPALWALIGISGGTAVISSLIMKPGSQENPGASTQILPARRTQVAYHRDPADADLSDIVYGETEEDKNVVDSTRVQAVAMTALLVAIFANLVLEAAEGIGGVTILDAARNGLQVFGKMPPASGTFLWLLAASHGTLLGGKLLGAYKNSGAKPSG